jgi:hypothetical protein
MLIRERLSTPRGKEITREIEITGTINEHILKLDSQGWKIIEIKRLEGGCDAGIREPGDVGQDAGNNEHIRGCGRREEQV